MRRNLWALVLSGVGFFLSLLLPTLMTMQNALEQRAQGPEGTVTGKCRAKLAEFDEQRCIPARRRQPVCQDRIHCAGGRVRRVDVRPTCIPARRWIFTTACRFRAQRLFANNFLTGVVCTFSTYFVMLAVTVACSYAMGCGEAVRLE